MFDARCVFTPPFNITLRYCINLRTLKRRLVMTGSNVKWHKIEWEDKCVSVFSYRTHIFLILNHSIVHTRKKSDIK